MPEKLILPNGTSLEGLYVSEQSSCHNDRSFLIDELSVAIDERLLYPVDEETRTPHLIRIFDEGSYKYGQYSCKEDYDHSWYYSSSPDLKDPGGKAVRNSMGQVIPRRIHKIKNSRFGGLVWLPHTNTEKFVATIAGITGVASRWAVDVRRPDNDLLVYLDDTEFEFLTDKKRFHRQEALKDSQANRNRNVIGLFLVSYAIERGVRGIISDKLIDQFLNTEDEINRKMIGNFILKSAITENVSQLNINHSALKAKGLVRPDAFNPSIAVWKYIKKAKLPDYYSAMTEKLLKSAA